MGATETPPAVEPSSTAPSGDDRAEGADGDAAEGDGGGRIRSLTEAGRARLTAGRDELERRRHAVPIVDVLWHTFERDRLVNGGVLAAAVAFRLFLFVIPLALVLIVGLGLMADSSGESPKDLARQAGITGLIASSVGNAGSLTTLNRIVLLAGGLYATLRAAKSLLRVLDTAHALVWGDAEVPKRTATSVLGLMATALGIVAVVLAVGRVRMETPGPGLLLTVLLGVVPGLIWLRAASRLPHGSAPRWALVPGAVVLAVGVLAAHVFTVYYLSRQVEGRSQTYGALGVAMAVLLWCYLISRLVLVASAVNAAAWQRHHGHDPSPVADEPLHRWLPLLRAELVDGSPAAGDGAARPRAEDGAPIDREDTAMATLTVWKFASPEGANQAESTLEGLAKQQLITIEDAATVTWQPDKKKPKTRQLHNLAGLGALDGAFWGMLFGLIFFVPLLGAAVGAAAGALGGSMADVGIDDDLISSVRAQITPGTSALFLLSSDAVVDRVREAFEGVDMELVSTNLSHDAEAKLRETFTH